MPAKLSPARRSELRAEAHKLKPVVIIGDKGLTDEVLAEVDRSLKAHELIKVRAATNERDARDVWLEEICAKLEAHPVQQIGKVFVIYREEPAKDKPAKTPTAVPKPAPRAKTAKARAGAPKASRKRGTPPPRSRAPSPPPKPPSRRRARSPGSGR